MFSFSRKAPPRRAEIRKNRPDTASRRWEQMKASGVPASVGIAAVFALVAVSILALREEVVHYRPGQQVHHDVVARVNFTFHHKEQLSLEQQDARRRAFRVYAPNGDVWATLREKLLALPDRLAAAAVLEDVSPDLRAVLDPASFSRLKVLGERGSRPAYDAMVASYVEAIRAIDPNRPETGLFVLPPDDREEDLARQFVTIRTGGEDPVEYTVRAEAIYTPRMREALERRLATDAAEGGVDLELQSKFVNFTLDHLQASPTHVLDEAGTVEAQNRAEAAVPRSAGAIEYPKNQVIVKAGETIDDRHWQVLRAEHEAFLQSLDHNLWKSRAGAAVIVLIVTVVLSAYVAKFEPRVIRKHPRAIAIAVLMLSMLLLAQLAGIGPNQLHFFAVAPTIMVAMIMAIVYNQRFAMGMGLIHAALVTVAVGQGFAFLLVVSAGVLTCCFLIDDIRARSKLVEVGGATAVAMMLTTAAVGAMSLDPIRYIGTSVLWTGAAGLAVGLFVLGALPFIEKAFRITTGMTLLELGDPAHPLLRRLQAEAPGTYNHSLQVATIAEAAADAIGADSLLCRVAGYYHDVGKINKADYFIENQTDGHNRHINLSPSVSLLIIIGHVKDGMELAREYNLPTSLFPFIQTHHGTTLVEYFYHRACNSPEARQPDAPAISENQYRYPGPKPRSKECGIVMIADACESATRAMTEPTANRIEALVHDLVMKRLLDGQFDDCELTMAELEQVERSCVRTLVGIYHGRIAYPSQSATVTAASQQQAPAPSQAASPAPAAVRPA